MNRYLTFLFGLMIIASCADPSPTMTTADFLNYRKTFKTKLIKKIEAPQWYTEFEKVRGAVKLVHYNSNGLRLKALLDTTNIEVGKQKPVLVYLHGGFSMSYIDLDDCQPFVDAGYIVFAPTYRGENGNEGHFEMYMGEVNDAEASITWLMEQPYVDKENIFVFGHSAGGALSLCMTLYSDLPIKAYGSCAGLTDRSSFEYMQEQGDLPFDLNNEEEIILRLPISTLGYLRSPHQMYIGTDDGYQSWSEFYQELYPEQNTLLTILEVEGNHSTSLPISMNRFIEDVMEK